jgi:hypothetical protein
MKKLLQNKLSAFIVTTMLFSATSNAQIVYTDVNPDSSYACNGPVGTPCNYTYNLDLNGDSTTDFLIDVSRHTIGPPYKEAPYTSYVSITPQGSNAFITTTLNTVKKLVLGDTISSSRAWHQTTYQYLKEWYVDSGSDTIIFTNTGEWDSIVDGYIGLQLLNGGQTYCGWVRMDVSVSGSYASTTIKDYAYNSIPDQPILAGETIATGIIENSFASSICLFPNPATSHLTISTGTNNKKMDVTITDITGKIIYTTIEGGTQKIEVNTNDFAEGVYLVKVQSADFVATKQLVVAK